MTQNKVVIQSGNNSLRAYNVDGVITPARGLVEYVLLKFDEKIVNNLQFPINLKTIIFRLNGIPNSGDMYSLEVNGEVYHRSLFDPDFASKFSEELPPLIIVPNQEIKITSYEVTFNWVMLVAEKCALSQLIDTSTDS